MRIITDIKNFPDELANSCIALGNFDGVHLGHQEIIRAVKQKAREMGVPAGIVTFWPHPRDVLAHDHPHKYIMTKAQKLQALEELGLDFVLLIDFDIELSKQSHEDFISALKAQTLAIIFASATKVKAILTISRMLAVSSTLLSLALTTSFFKNTIFQLLLLSIYSKAHA